jgi:hypothetical protein
MTRDLKTANIYISTVDVGRVLTVENTTWWDDGEAFENLFAVWCWLKGYTPQWEKGTSCPQ